MQNYSQPNLLWLILHWCFWKVLWELLLCSVSWVDRQAVDMMVINVSNRYFQTVYQHIACEYFEKNMKITVISSFWLLWINKADISALFFCNMWFKCINNFPKPYSFRCSSDVFIWFDDVINWFREQMLCFYTSIVCIYVTVMTCVKMLNQKHIKR